ncbi:4649_t:CDS:10 [Diversispora eburnea]|uniref:4649_t:CDS:1 n=1 Tax=Diversispora eburnea TaxID=1213867 RepID=A0A9N8ZQS0_9GLOM|nr:4649_t:CDS:10 [Diversispora eburnea]
MSVSHVARRTTSVSSGSSLMNIQSEDHIFSSNVEDYDININSPIGYGASAIVYGATYKPLSKKVAVKMIDLDHFERNQIDEVRRETQLMSLSKHPNVLRVYGSFVNESKLFIATPYMSAGSCSDIMKTSYPDGFEEAVIATILKQALQGLDYLHKNGHIHRDVKAGNLLVDEDGSVLLADFGVSSSLTENGDRRFRRTFPCWMAPEIMQHAGYDYKADIWSFGITALELATGHAPFAKFPPLKVILVTLSNDPPTLDRDTTKHKYTKSFKEMIDLCLQKDPSKRPTAERLLTHAFFKQAKRKEFLVTKILHHLPPLEERPHKRGQQKPITYTKGDPWDFENCGSGESGEYSENKVPDEIFEKRVGFSLPSDVGEIPKEESKESKEPPKKSRFFFEDSGTNTESSNPQTLPTSNSPSSTTSVASQNLFSQTGLSGPNQNTQDLAEKKGRFVINNPNQRDRAMSQSEIENQRPNLAKENSNENLTENKKSRFEVQSTSQQSLDISKESSLQSPSLSRESPPKENSTNKSTSRFQSDNVDSPTTEKSVNTQKGRFHVSSSVDVTVTAKVDGPISLPGNFGATEITCSPQSTYMGPSPNMSPTTSILRGQGLPTNSNSISSHIAQLLHQNEAQRNVLNELQNLYTSEISGTSSTVGRMTFPPQFLHPQFPALNGNVMIKNTPKEISTHLNSLDRQFQKILNNNNSDPNPVTTGTPSTHISTKTHSSSNNMNNDSKMLH